MHPNAVSLIGSVDLLLPNHRITIRPHGKNPFLPIIYLTPRRRLGRTRQVLTSIAWFSGIAEARKVVVGTEGWSDTQIGTGIPTEMPADMYYDFKIRSIDFGSYSQAQSFKLTKYLSNLRELGYG